MKKLGRIFRKYWKWIIGFVLVLLVLVFLKPLKFLGIFSSKTDRIAYDLYLSMYRNGTNEDDILDLLRPLSSSELIRVYKSFGVRGYGFNGAFVGAKELDLFGWFSKEFSKVFDAKKLRELRDIWSKTGLEITF